MQHNINRSRLLLQCSIGIRRLNFPIARHGFYHRIQSRMFDYDWKSVMIVRSVYPHVKKIKDKYFSENSNPLVDSTQIILDTSDHHARTYVPTTKSNNILFSRLNKFCDTYWTVAENVDQIHQGIRGLEIPAALQEKLCQRVTGAHFVRSTPDVVLYETKRESNGGIGYVCDMICTYDVGTKKYSFVLAISGLEFDIQSDVQYIPKDRVKHTTYKDEGWFSTNTTTVEETFTEYEKIVKPRGITREEFNDEICKAHVDFYKSKGKPALESILKHGKLLK